MTARCRPSAAFSSTTVRHGTAHSPDQRATICARAVGQCLGHRAASGQRSAAMRGQRAAAVDCQSGPRPESRHLRQPALEGLTNSARMETPQRGGRNKSDEGAAAAAALSGGGVRLGGEEGRPRARG
ncbi:hypothetical protein F511_16599 [Dorcoceras hygrometricum]|uniref:Uncharacterized protein n=1 Tax=Dorcoceras hygrometricum TaxID=472368 RepID=A0A2Z7CAY4_9LAMI|nr:hypothetical protein F511_16599 [Dorcoceras hygrometricum]